MRILVTGAAGYIGSALVRFLRARGLDVIGTDQSAPADVTGNIAYPPFARSLVTPDTGAVFHLASLVSGGAEQNFELGTKVNLDATRDLLEACRLAGQRPKFLFASSIAVYSGVEVVTDETPPRPRLSYGTQKLVCELLIEDYTRRGFVEGTSLRLPTVMVRPGGANTAVSGWASAIIREPLAGRDYVCPVGPDATIWVASKRTTIANLLRFADVDGEAIGAQRAVTAPALAVSIGELVAALGRVDPGAPAHVRFAADARLEAQFGRWPRDASFARAESLGLVRDASIDAIIREYATP
jgi:nucleoside-diphosphate-sugar epimerase